MFNVQPGKFCPVISTSTKTRPSPSKGWGPFAILPAWNKVSYRESLQRRFALWGRLVLRAKPCPRMQAAAQATGAPAPGAPSQTPAPGPTALGFSTPAVGPHALSFSPHMPGAAPCADATAGVAGAAMVVVGGLKRSRTVVDKNGGGPHVLPAARVPGPAGEAPDGKRRRGKSKGRTPASSVGAAQRLGENLVHFNDAGQKLAVEGTVAGDAGKRHFAAACGVAMFVGAVPPGSKGGRVSEQAKEAARAAPMQVYVMTNDAGGGHGPGRISRRCFGQVLQAAATALLAHEQSPGSYDLDVASASVQIAPRVHGHAQLGSFEVTRAAAATHAGPAPGCQRAGGAGVPSHGTVVQQLHAGLQMLATVASAGEAC